MNIYVANIHFEARENELKSLFEKYGEVSSVKIVLDRETKKSRGFGFVVMNNDAKAKEVIQNLNGYNFKGKVLAVKEATPQKDTREGFTRNTNTFNPQRPRREPGFNLSEPVVGEAKPNKSSEHKKKKDERDSFESERKIKKSFDKKKRQRGGFDEDDDDNGMIYRIKY